MNIVIRELQANGKSLLIWCGSMIFLIYAGMLKYSGFASAGQSVNELFNQFPPAVKAVFGLGDLDITSMAGFYAVFYLYFMVLAGVHAVMLGAVIISKEERDKTADFLFAKPVLRSKIITSKLLAALVNIVVLNLVTLFASVIFVDMFNTGKPITDIILRLMFPLFILQLIFAALGAGIAAATRNVKKATSLSTTLLLTTFMISVAIDLYNKIDFLKYLTPFKYFPAAKVIQTGNYATSFLILSLLLVSISIAITYYFMKKRDLQA